jgi:hypothetical protein
MIGAVLKLIIFTSMVNRIINASRNERVTQQIYDTYLSLLNVAEMPAEQKQLIHASQIAVHKTLFAPESPLSFCSVTDRERRGEWDCACACAQNLNTCCFIPYGETYFCVRFESRNGRLKPLQSFWYTLYVSRNNYTAYLWKPVLFGIQFAVERGNTPLSNGICHDDSPFFGVLKKRSKQKDSVAMDHYELQVRRIRGASGDCNSRAGTAQKVYTLRFRGYLNPTRLCFGDGCSVFVRQEV